MDSGNSGSLQSSSGGGDENIEYDSRQQLQDTSSSSHFLSSSSSFLNPNTHFGSHLPPQPPPLLNHHHHHHHHQPTTLLFDPPPPNPLFQYPFLPQFPPNPNPNPSDHIMNLEMVRSQNSLPSDPIPSNTTAASVSATESTLPPSQNIPHHDRSNQSAPGVMPPKNPKKRTRASRRAPTTVLTTDTSNFRAMVQEFTGIPAPPFSGSPFARRLDLFGSGSGFLRMGLDATGGGSSFPLRPSPLKVHQSPLMMSSSFNNNNNTMLENNIDIASSSSLINSGSDNYQQQNQMMSLQNQMLPLQSMLQQHPPQILDMLTSSSSSSSTTTTTINIVSSSNMGSGEKSQQTSNVFGLQNLGGVDNDVGGGGATSSSDCRLNYNVSSSFHNEKVGLENVNPSRNNQGATTTVDSWSAFSSN